MLFKALVFSIISSLAIQAQAFPKIKPDLKPAYFDVNEFSQCIAARMIWKFGKNGARDRLLAIEKLRQELFKQYSPNYHPITDNWFDFWLETGREFLGPYQYLHSVPFVDVNRFYEKTWGSGPLMWRLKEIYNIAQPNGIDLVNDSGFYERLMNFSTKQYNFDPNAPFPVKVDGIETPLIDWLLHQRTPYSVTHTQVLNKAMELYENDVFTALGVIGHLFYSDANQIYDRKRITYLGARMRSVTVPDGTFEIDQVGENYHFWSYLNISMTGGLWLMKTITYTYESIYQNDMGEYSADYWAEWIGGKVRDLVMKGTYPGLENCQ